MVNEASLTTVPVVTPTVTTVPALALNATTPIQTTVPPQINPSVNQTLPTTVSPVAGSIILNNITTQPVSQASNNATSS